MNARQAAKAAAKKIEELEYYNLRCITDIRAYNKCIDSMIQGGSPCEWCEEEEECQRECKGKGCSEWWLKDITPTVVEDDDDDSKGIYGASAEG